MYALNCIWHAHTFLAQGGCCRGLLRTPGQPPTPVIPIPWAPAPQAVHQPHAWLLPLPSLNPQPHAPSPDPSPQPPCPSPSSLLVRQAPASISRCLHLALSPPSSPPPRPLSSNSYDQSVQGDATWITKYIPFSDSYAGEELSFPLSDQLEEGYYNTSATISLLTSYPRLTDLVGLNQIAQTDAAGAQQRAPCQHVWITRCVDVPSAGCMPPLFCSAAELPLSSICNTDT